MQEALTTTPLRRLQPARHRRVIAPSLSDFLFGCLLVWLFVAGEGGQGLLGDGDTGWHIRTGDYVLEHKSVPRKDIFSYTRPDGSWYAWEWLSDVIFASLHRLWGLKGVVLLAGMLCCAATTILFSQMLRAGGNLFICLLTALLANAAASVHYLARPHLFTLLFLVISLWLVDRDRRCPTAAIWWLVPLSALWVNLHGGFPALLVSLGLIATGYVLEGWPRLSDPLGKARRYALLMAACGAATLLNPYGWRLHWHVLEYMRADFISDLVEEFQSPKFRGESMMQFELLLFLALGLGGLLLKQRRFADALLLVFWAQAALGSTRHIPIFVFVVTPLVAEQLTAVWNDWVAGKSGKSIAGILRDLSEEFGRLPLRTTLWAPVLAGSVALASASHLPTNFLDKRFPVSMVDRQAARLAPASGPAPRVFTSDQWGDYLTYHFYPHVKIFFDGRSDFFGRDFVDEYIKLANGRYGWDQVLDRYQVDVVMVPVSWPLAELLKRAPGWKVADDDHNAILFLRTKPVLMKLGNSVERIDLASRSTRE